MVYQKQTKPTRRPQWCVKNKLASQQSESGRIPQCIKKSLLLGFSDIHQHCLGEQSNSPMHSKPSLGFMWCTRQLLSLSNAPHCIPLCPVQQGGQIRSIRSTPKMPEDHLRTATLLLKPMLNGVELHGENRHAGFLHFLLA